MEKIKVAVVMGSESDLPVMRKACDTLKTLGIAHKTFIASAHRTPELLAAIVARCERAGALVYIAGAGGAAHLPGVIASMTLRPVIGVPVNSKLSGLDSLLSIAQMPSGVPVAAMAVDGSANAAILAAQILAAADKNIHKKLALLRRGAAEKISQANDRLNKE
ncbi:MAG: 5-(carboxyamino)imidazole ribonucleotide mutase [Elusimicrobiales bacterium]